MYQRQDQEGSWGDDLKNVAAGGDHAVAHFRPEFTDDEWWQAGLTIEGSMNGFDVVYSGNYLNRDVDGSPSTTPTTRSTTTTCTRPATSRASSSTTMAARYRRLTRPSPVPFCHSATIVDEPAEELGYLTRRHSKAGRLRPNIGRVVVQMFEDRPLTPSWNRTLVRYGAGTC